MWNQWLNKNLFGFMNNLVIQPSFKKVTVLVLQYYTLKILVLYEFCGLKKVILGYLLLNQQGNISEEPKFWGFSDPHTSAILYVG